MRFLPLAVLALLAPSLASANELARLYGLAQDNDTQLQAAAAARDAALEASPATRGQLLPQVGAQGSYSHQQGTITSNTQTCTRDFSQPYPPPLVCFIPPPQDQSGNPYALTLSLRQVLFDAAVWNRWQQADATGAAAEAQYETAAQGLALRTTSAYFDLLAAADNVRFVDAEKKAFERQLELAKKRFEVGLSAVTDVQEAQARYDLSVSQMIAAEQALVSAKLAVTEITGKSDTRVVPLKDEIPLIGPNPDNVNAWLKTASDSNLDIKLAEAQAESAKQDIDIARAGHYPTVSVTGSKGKGHQQQGPQDFDYDQTRVELDVTVPIFSGGTTNAQVNAAKSTHQQRLALLDAQKRAVEKNVRNAYQGVLTGIAQVKALKQAVVSNTTALEASEVGLEVGSRTAVDVLNAQQQLYGAQRDYSKSRYDYLKSILLLKQAAGVLMQKDLNEIDGLLGTEVAADVAG